jgi:hypothetical protein
MEQDEPITKAEFEVTSNQVKVIAKKIAALKEQIAINNASISAQLN